MKLSAERVEDICRYICKQKGIDPDLEASPIRDDTKEKLGSKYKLWEYQREFTLLPVMDALLYA